MRKKSKKAIETEGQWVWEERFDPRENREQIEEEERMDEGPAEEESDPWGKR